MPLCCLPIAKAQGGGRRFCVLRQLHLKRQLPMSMFHICTWQCGMLPADSHRTTESCSLSHASCVAQSTSLKSHAALCWLPGCLLTVTADVDDAG
jgi:hypothetical protein